MEEILLEHLTIWREVHSLYQPPLNVLALNVF